MRTAMASIVAPAWAFYRAARTITYKLTKRAPLSADLTYLSLAEHLSMTRSLLTTSKPKLVGQEGPLGRWETAMGSFWCPASVSKYFVEMISAEVRANIYGYASEPGAVVLDCGANIGMFARYAIDHGAGRVVCLEPSQRTAEALRRNVPEAEIVERGAWDSATTLRFQTHEANPGADRIAVGGEVEIITATIDALVVSLQLERIDFIKMDIEGAELAALRGAWKTLQQFRPPLAVATEHTSDILENNRRVLEYLKPLGYSVTCSECHIVDGKLTPYVLRFVPPAQTSAPGQTVGA